MQATSSERYPIMSIISPILKVCVILRSSSASVGSVGGELQRSDRHV
jgi:hypothetical protein